MEPMNSLVTLAQPASVPARTGTEEPVAGLMEGPLPLGHYALHIDRIEGGHLLRLTGPEGERALEIALTPEGPVLRLHGGLRMDLVGDLAIDAKRVSLHGREGLVLSSGTDAALVAAGDFSVQAELGDVSVRANDDVRIDGERIRMNC